MQRNASVFWKEGGVQIMYKYNFERFIFFMCSIFSLLSKLTIYWFSCLACPKLALVKKVTLKVKKFSWHTAQKVSIPKIQCEWPMQLLFAVFREETCTYSWAVAQQSLESFHSFGMKKYDEQSNYFCVSLCFSRYVL